MKKTNASLEELNDIWDERIRKHKEIRPLKYNQFRSKQYNESITIKEDGINQAKKMNVKDTNTILDIGSGPGTLAIPLAKTAKKVTCIEPSTSMISLLKKNALNNNLRNIDIINEKWENIHIDVIGCFDIVIASYCLAMENIVELLKKMNNIAIEKIYIYWFDGETSWDKFCHVLYPKTHCCEYVSLPKADILFSILKKLNYIPQIQFLTSNFPRSYENINKAIEDLRTRLNINNESYDAILKKYILENYRFENDYIIWDDDTKYVEITWVKK